MIGTLINIGSALSKIKGSKNPYKSAYPDNNPYADIDPLAQLSGLQRTTDFLGLTNYAEKAMYQHNLLTAQRDIDLEAREYNSEASQVARQRAAGLNPDLLGVSGNEFAPSQPVEGGVVPEDASQKISGLGNFLLSAFTTGFSMLQGMQSMDIAAIDAAGGLDSIIGSAEDKIISSALDNMSVEDMLKNDKEVFASDFLNSSVKTAEESYFPMVRTKSVRKMLDRELSNRLAGQDFKNRKYAKAAEFYENQARAAEARGNMKGLDLLAQESGSDDVTDYIAGFYKASRGLIKLQTDWNTGYFHKKDADKVAAADNAAADASKAYSDYTKGFYGSADASQAGQAFNDQNKMQSEYAKYQVAVNKEFRNFINNLVKEADAGKKWAQVVLTAIGFTQNVSIPGVSIPIQNHNSVQNRYGDTQTIVNSQ